MIEVVGVVSSSEKDINSKIKRMGVPATAKYDKKCQKWYVCYGEYHDRKTAEDVVHDLLSRGYIAGIAR